MDSANSFKLEVKLALNILQDQKSNPFCNLMDTAIDKYIYLPNHKMWLSATIFVLK